MISVDNSAIEKSSINLVKIVDRRSSIVDMERLWSPWRLSYVSGASGSSTSSGCIFCDATGTIVDPAREALVLVRARLSFVILNLFPYNNGHLMVTPNRHVATLSAASDDELAELVQLTRDAELVLTEAYRPEGINVGLNLGRAAGAGIADHLHIHVVPRWTGDTSFISVVGDTRVIPEDLGDTAKRLRPIFERLTHRP